MIGEHPMRKPEHRIIDRDIICAVLDNIEFVTVGAIDGDYPYMVPLNFGYEFTEDKLLVYVHCAKEGHKIDVWRKNNKVTCVFSMFQNHPHIRYRGSIHDFRCVMANGIIRQIDPKQEAGLFGRAIQNILAHNHRRPAEFSLPHYMFMTQFVIECDLENVSAKSEMPVASPADVPFPPLEKLILEGEGGKPSSDFESLVAKTYKCRPGAAYKAEFPMPLEPFTIEASQARITMSWTAPSDGSLDADLYAYVIGKDGAPARRYSFACYQQLSDVSGALTHLGDDMKYVAGWEAVDIDFEKLPEDAVRIDLVLAVHRADERGQSLANVGPVAVAAYADSSDFLSSGTVFVPGLAKPSAVLASLEKTEDGWYLSSQPKGFDSWDFRSVAFALGLKKWKE